MACRAEKSQAPFYCIECKEEVILRKGKVRMPHYAHKPDRETECAGGNEGSAETWQHALAKQLVVKCIDKWRFYARCRTCKTVSGHIVHHFPASEGFFAAEEKPVPPYRIDVLVTRNGEAHAAIEVHQTHAVDDKKRKDLEARGILVIEVEAESVIEQAADHEEGVESQYGLHHYQHVPGCTRCAQLSAEYKRKSRRPCIDCRTWHDPCHLRETEKPPEHKYPMAYLCLSCESARKLCKPCVDCGHWFQPDTMKMVKTTVRTTYLCAGCQREHQLAI